MHSPPALLHIKPVYTLHEAVQTKRSRPYEDWNRGKKSNFSKCFSNCWLHVFSFSLNKNKYFQSALWNKSDGINTHFQHWIHKNKFLLWRKTQDFKQPLTRSMIKSNSYCSSSCSWDFISTAVFLPNCFIVSFVRNIIYSRSTVLIYKTHEENLDWEKMSSDLW